MESIRIAVLLHENLHKIPDWYFMNYLVKCWQAEGHEVEFIFGTKKFVPADVLFVHVDLSVVPDSYLEFAECYPVAINGKVKDIRKSLFSEGLLRAGDSWDGKVIVKSDKNYAGAPELRKRKTEFWGRAYNKLRRTVDRMNLDWLAPILKRPRDYLIYDHLSEVPRLYFYNPDLVIQKFKPEMDEGLYCVRFFLFLGDHTGCIRLKATTPIVNTRDIVAMETEIEPHPDIVSMRRQFQFDYGKFDYVEVNGEAFLLDTNKTIGAPHANDEIAKELNKGIVEFSGGLYSFFDELQVE